MVYFPVCTWMVSSVFSDNIVHMFNKVAVLVEYTTEQRFMDELLWPEDGKTN